MAIVWYYLSNAIFFLLSIFCAFYLPGRVVLGKKSGLSYLPTVTLSLILGIVLWGMQGFIFGYLGQRGLSYLYLAAFLGVFVWQKYWCIQKATVRSFLHNAKKHIDILSAGIFALGVIVQTFMYFKMGFPTKEGIVWAGGKDSVDQVWHSALVSELIQRFPPQEPGMYGIQLVNYHYWFNLVTAELIRVFHLSQLPIQFLGMYPLASILLGLTVYLVSRQIYPSKLFLRWTLFLIYFAADSSFWYTALLGHGINFHVQSLFADSTEFLFSPPFSFAAIILLAGIYLFFKKYQKFDIRSIGILSLLFGSLIGFKVYVALPLLAALFFLSVFDLLHKRYQTFCIFLLSSIFSAAIFLPVNGGSGGLFFLPVAMPRIFISDKILGLSIINVIWDIYWSHKNYLRLAEYSLILAVMYYILQFGIRVFGLIPTKHLFKTLGREKVIFFFGYILVASALGLFSYQRFGGANVWQFFLGMVLLLSFLTALNLTFLQEKLPKVVGILFALLIIVFVIPRAIATTAEQYTLEYQAPFHGFSYEEMSPYDFLRTHSKETDSILLLGQTRYTQYASIANVFIQRGLYFSGEGEYQSPTPEILQRRQDKKTILTSKDTQIVKEVLQRDKIDFIYLYNPTTLNIPLEKVGKIIFQNTYATVIQVGR